MKRKKRTYTYRSKRKGVLRVSRLSVCREREAKEGSGPLHSELLSCNSASLNSVDETFAIGQRRLFLLMSRAERNQWMNDSYDPVNGRVDCSGMPTCYRFFRTGLGTSVDLLKSVKNTECAPALADLQ